MIDEPLPVRGRETKTPPKKVPLGETRSRLIMNLSSGIRRLKNTRTEITGLQLRKTLHRRDNKVHTKILLLRRLSEEIREKPRLGQQSRDKIHRPRNGGSSTATIISFMVTTTSPDTRTNQGPNQ